MRPEGYKNPYRKDTVMTSTRDGAKHRVFEAGADAYEEGLKKGGFISGESLRNIKGAMGWGCISPKSKWYCIPEE